MQIGTSDRYDLSRELQYLEDPGGQLTLEDVSSPSFLPDFRAFDQKGSAYNFGLTSSAYWIRVSLDVTAEAPLHWMWEVGHPRLNHVDVYVQQPGGSFSHSVSGDALPFSARAIPHKDHVLPVQLFPGARTTVYMRVKSEGVLIVPVRLWRPPAFLSNGHLEYALLAAYFGVLLSMLFYNLVLYVVIRDRAYLVYVAFVAAMAGTQASLTGLAAEFIWRDNVQWNNDGMLHSIALTLFTAVAFTRSFLGTRLHMPRQDRVLFAVAVTSAAMFVALPFLPYQPVSRVQNVLCIVTAAACALAGGTAWRQGRPGARFFLVAWGMLFAGTCVLALRNLGILPSNFFTQNALLIGSALEMVLLSFALADRISATRRDRQQALARERSEQLRTENAERAHQEKSRFLAAISHDLRQPMYALGLSIDSLEHARLAGPIAPLVPEMKSALSSIHALLDSLLFMSRLETGKVEAVFTTVDAGRLLERVRLTFEAQAQRKGLRLTVIPCMTPIRSDPVLLERILSNLVGNALRYTESGGVLVAARPRAGGVLLQVWDTGPGIADNQREAIFDEFFRLPRDEADAGDAGVGLGLSIVRNCARLLGCTVSVASRVGRGSCFSVLLPAMEAASGQAAAEAPAPAKDGALHGMRVAVIDDEPVVRRTLSAALALRGCHVVPAASGDEIEQLLERGVPPDAIVTDYDLGPRETGIDVIHRLRVRHGRVPAIVITGDTSPGTAARLTEARLPFLYKPASPGELASLLQRIATGVPA
ncbi:MAG: hybrid sensor histidine kinase/response regulator [Burkholderiaceae bacterium]